MLVNTHNYTDFVRNLLSNTFHGFQRRNIYWRIEHGHFDFGSLQAFPCKIYLPTMSELKEKLRKYTFCFLLVPQARLDHLISGWNALAKLNIFRMSTDLAGKNYLIFQVFLGPNSDFSQWEFVCKELKMMDYFSN